MRMILKAAWALAATGALMIPHVPAAAQEAAQKEGQAYSVTETQVGTLLDDPAAAAILKRLIPTVFANEMFQSMGRPQTLKAIQQYEPVELSDEKLAEIQAEFDKLAAGK
ncbi:conserved hypothetical protein [Altererythrobacter sp. B11]|uniref:hypothetical protein n=1 Tax=Altererythrobacter sp. B11 TaxID=2060312 RepID=UPI000DC6D4EF|nr:hypothetical protein [Altererythrobacter sp. B11]BBC71810.1 conserved hypothetical protein [Altererythrobacter sp. B11]